MSTKATSVPSKTLAQAILSTDTTFRLSDILGWNGSALTSSDFGSVAFGAFLSADRTVMELFSYDPTTIASSSVLFIDRGLYFTGVNTSVTANKLDWPAGSTTVQLGSDIPQLMALFAGVQNTNAFTGSNSFTLLPTSTGGDATIGTQLVTYAQALAMATGTAAINRIVVAGNAGETVAAGNFLYLDVADGEWKKCDADTAATVDNIILGLAQGAGTDGNLITSGVLIFGLDSNQTGLTNDSPYYASNTAGAISSTPGTTEVSVGISRSTTSILFYPRYNQQLTEDQQDALVGTSGTPSASNKYVTNDDTTGTGDIVRSSITDSILITLFGDGSDGDVVISSNTSLTRDMFYDDLTINNGITLSDKGFRVYVKGTLTCVGTGKIAANGNAGGDATSTTAGAAGTASYITGTLPIPLPGKIGRTPPVGEGSNGTAGDDAVKPLTGSNTGAAGGAGGNFNATLGGLAGVGGAVTSPMLNIPRAITQATLLFDIQSTTATLFSVSPSSASGGSGANGGASGGSGSSGGVVWIAANTIVLLNAESIGGNGGSGSNDGSSGGGGGGGAGNGGAIFVIYASKTTVNTNVSGGTRGNGGAGAGAGAAAGTNGADGTAGVVYTFGI